MVVYTHTHTHIHMHTDTYIQTHMHIHTHTHTHMHMHTFVKTELITFSVFLENHLKFCEYVRKRQEQPFSGLHL